MNTRQIDVFQNFQCMKMLIYTFCKIWERKFERKNNKKKIRHVFIEGSTVKSGTRHRGSKDDSRDCEPITDPNIEIEVISGRL